MAQVSGIADEQTSTPLSSSNLSQLELQDTILNTMMKKDLWNSMYLYEKWTTVLEAISRGQKTL